MIGERRATELLLIILCILALIPEVSIVKAEGPILIKSDGSIEGTDKIQRDGNIYSLSGNIIFNASDFYGIKVETDNIVIDGAGYTIQGAGIGRGIEIANPYNATIKTSYNVLQLKT